MSERVKVVFCTDGVFPQRIGGMQRHSRLLIEALDKTDRVEMVVIHPHDAGIFGGCRNVVERPIRDINPGKIYLSECWDYSKRVAECLGDYPDWLVYSQGLSVWSRIVYLPQKVIINPHGLEAYQGLTFKDWGIGLPVRCIFNSLFRKADRVVSLGGNLTRILRKQIKGRASKVVVIPNATNVSGRATEVARMRQFGQETRFLFVGRFASNKGIRYLLDAVHRLNAEGYSEKVIFDLVGNGPLYEKLVGLCDEPNVTFHGSVSDQELGALYEKADAFLFPTLFEGMPTVILEAMSWGLPIISTDVGAVSELVDHDNGLVIEKGSADAISEAVKNFSDLSPARKRVLGQASFDRVRTGFRWEIIAEQHLELFSDLYFPTN